MSSMNNDFRLFFAYSTSGEANLTYSQWRWDERPLNVLVAFPFIKQWQDRKWMGRPSRTILDSGAYSAWNSGKTIDIDALIKETKSGKWDESICLDVIGDPEASMRNAEYMKKNNSPAFPVFHIGDPWEMLREYCNEFDRVGISCRFGESPKESMIWAGQCFAREWPHKFHSFGWVAKDALMAFPFATADTASWNNGPARWGRWNAFKGSGPQLKGARSLVAEVDWYLKLENEVKGRWARILREAFDV